MMTFLDIESIPKQPEAEAKALIAETIEAPAQMKKAETIAEWHNGAGKYTGVKDAAIEEKYRKTGLDGTTGEVISVCFTVDDEITLLHRGNYSTESDLLVDLFARLSAQRIPTDPYFIGHNIPWDLKFLWQRAVINRVPPGIELPFGGRHEQQYYDNAQAWAGFRGFISQDDLAKALGLPGKPTDIDGSNVWDHYKAGDINRIAEYNQDDVEQARMIYNRINFIL